MTRQGLLKQIQRRNEPLKRIAELKDQNDNLIAMLKAEREVRVNDDYLKGICEKDAEIADLKEQLECAEHNCKVKQEFNDNQFKAIMDFRKRAKEILRDLLDLTDKLYMSASGLSGMQIAVIERVQDKAKEFLKECQ